MIEKFEGIVVKEVNYKDTSKIIHIFTKEKGIISVIARGAKKIKSPLFAGTNYLAYCIFCLLKKGDVFFLKSVDMIGNFKNILKDITRISAAKYIIDLSTQVYNENNTNDIYLYLISALKKVNDKINPLGIINILEVKYLKYLGIDLNLSSCSICGSLDIASISLGHNGYLCNRCSNWTVDKKLLKLIKSYYYVDIKKLEMFNVNNEILLQLNEFIDKYYEKYSGLYLKDKEFFIKLYLMDNKY